MKRIRSSLTLTDCAALLPLKSVHSKRRISDTIDVFSWRAELLGRKDKHIPNNDVVGEDEEYEESDKT